MSGHSRRRAKSVAWARWLAVPGATLGFAVSTMVLAVNWYGKEPLSIRTLVMLWLLFAWGCARSIMRWRHLEMFSPRELLLMATIPGCLIGVVTAIWQYSPPLDEVYRLLSVIALGPVAGVGFYCWVSRDERRDRR